MTSRLAKQNFLFMICALTGFSMFLFSILYLVFEEHWDEQGSGEFSRVIAGNIVEIKTKEKTMRIKLAFVDAPSPQSVHGQDAIQYLKQICEYSDELHFRVKKVGNQYIGEVKRDSVAWDLSLNHSLISNGLVRVNDREKGEWKQNVIDHYIKLQKITKSVQKGVWAYDGYVTKDGFDPVIEKQIVAKKQMIEQ